jgi:hypothetical protein
MQVTLTNQNGSNPSFCIFCVGAALETEFFRHEPRLVTALPRDTSRVKPQKSPGKMQVVTMSRVKRPSCSFVKFVSQIFDRFLTGSPLVRMLVKHTY